MNEKSGSGVPRSAAETITETITALIAEHPQADEWGYPVEECCCGQWFDGSYATHVAAVLVKELHVHHVNPPDSEGLIYFDCFIPVSVSGDQPTEAGEKNA